MLFAKIVYAEITSKYVDQFPGIALHRVLLFNGTDCTISSSGMEKDIGCKNAFCIKYILGK